MAKNRLENFLNEEGQLTQWPAKLANQELVLDYLTGKLDRGITYTERQVNDILRSWHTFEDWAILRRALIDSGYMSRNRECTQYRRMK